VLELRGGGGEPVSQGKDRRKEGEEVKGQAEKRTHASLCTVLYSSTNKNKDGRTGKYRKKLNTTKIKKNLRGTT
jgi:hypothetical protein